MHIPSKNLGKFARELIDRCEVSRTERLMRGAVYKNLYLTGDENGNTATYNKIGNYIDTLSANLYSPVDLRWTVKHHGMVSPSDRAKGKAGASVMHEHMRETDLDTQAEEVTDWALIKGKAFIKLLWSRGRFDPYIVQPEMMGVLDESKPSLDRQEAFYHSIYMSPAEFTRLVAGRPDRTELLRKVRRYINPASGSDGPNNDNVLRQVILGGLNPYQQGGTNSPSRGRGVVEWLAGPSARFDAQVLGSLIRLDELWVWDDARDDWTTIQIVGDDLILYGAERNTNLFSQSTFENWKKTAGVSQTEASEDNNPLSKHHPFIEFCANPLNGYFWGISEMLRIALLQISITQRINGINSILRRQEDPPRAFFGSSSINQRALSILNKPGGYMSESSPNAKVQTLAPEMPGDLFASLREFIEMFDEIGGFPAVMKGKGEAGVRSQGHAETLVRTASPIFRRKALRIERSLENVGGLAFDILKACNNDIQEAWIPKDQAGVEATGAPVETLIEIPPAPGLVKTTFYLNQLNSRLKISVDGHSASPAFSGDTEQRIFALRKAGAVDNEYLLEHIALPDADDAEADLLRRQAQEAQLAKQNPELAKKQAEAQRKR